MTYYEALRLRVKMERLANSLVMVFVGMAIGAMISLIGWAWLWVVIGFVTMICVMLSYAASDGLQKRINNGEFDAEDSASRDNP